MAKVLIIDDDEQVRSTLAEVVETLGYEVRTAANGRLGLEAFSREPFDCVITDLAMPEVDGLGVLRQVKQWKPHTGVFVITGNSTVDLLAASVNMGADAYVTKPFKIRVIDEQLRRLVAAASGEHPRKAAAGGLLSTRLPLGWAIALVVTAAAAAHVITRLL